MCLLFNHKYEKEVKNGYQYCEKCGKARLVGKIKCQHQWENIDKYKENYYYGGSGIIYIQKCKNCGEIKKFSLN